MEPSAPSQQDNDRSNGSDVAGPNDPSKTTTPPDSSVDQPPDSNGNTGTLDGEEAMDTGTEEVKQKLEGGQEAADQGSPVQIPESESMEMDTEDSPTEGAEKSESGMYVEENQTSHQDSTPIPQTSVAQSEQSGRLEEISQESVLAHQEVSSQETHGDSTLSQIANPSPLETPVGDIASETDVSNTITDTSQAQMTSQAQVTSDYYSATDSSKEDNISKDVNEQGVTLSKPPPTVEKSHLEVENLSQSETLAEVCS